MLFQPLTSSEHSKYYVMNVSFISLIIVYIINAILGVETHENGLNMSLFGHSNKFCERILYQDCYFFTVYLIMLYTFSFFITLCISTLPLYIIQVYSKSYCSILLQSIFCCKFAYWKIICNKKYRINAQKKKDSELEVGLMSSEILSDFNVTDERELRVRFLSDVDENKPMDGSKQDDDTDDKANHSCACSTCFCVKSYRKCCYWYYNLYSTYKYLLLLCILNLSFLVCFMIFTLMKGAGTGDLPKTHYELIMVLWLIICFLMRSWMKYIGTQIDIVRLDMTLKFGIESKSRIGKILEVSKVLSRTMSTNLQRQHAKRSSYTNQILRSPHTKTRSNTNTPCKESEFEQCREDFPGVPTQRSTDLTLDYGFINYDEIQSQINDFRFDISMEIAMEIFIQVTYYTFYRDYTLIFYHPTWRQFIIFKLIHLLSIFVLYLIRILPIYYKYTSIMMDKCGFHDDEPFLVHQKTPMMGYQKSLFLQSSIPTSPVEVNEHSELETANNKKVTDYYSDGDDDVIHIKAVDNIFAFYDRERSSGHQKGSGTGFNYTLTSNVPSISSSPNYYNDSSGAKQSFQTDLGTTLTFQTYQDWRNRISIDCVIRCIAMIFTTLSSYCSVSIYYLTKNEKLLGKNFDGNSFKIATWYFLISFISELLIYWILYGLMKCYAEEHKNDNDDDNVSFNMFQPFTRLYAKSTNRFHYVMLFVVCSWWLY